MSTIKIYNNLDLKGNALLNCSNLTEFKEVTRAEFNDLKDNSLLDSNTVYLILVENSDEIDEVYYGSQLISTQSVVVVDISYEDYTRLKIDNKLNEKIFYVVVDDTQEGRPVYQIELTRAEYRELVNANAIDPSMFYIITDDYGRAELDNTSINDDIISDLYTWSSQQTQKRIDMSTSVWEPIPTN